MSRFEVCKAFTLAQEGGYSSDRNDSGNWLGRQLVGCYAGVTAADLLRCYGTARAPAITAGYMRHLPPDASDVVYRSWFASMGCDALPPGVDLSVFDFGFNAGARTSVMTLQMALGFPVDGNPSAAVDGYCGAGTAAAAAAAGPRSLVASLHDLQAAHYHGLAQFPRFGAGWLRRTSERRDAALQSLPT